MSHNYYHVKSRNKRYPLEITSPAQGPAVTLADAKEFIREDRNVEDGLITSLVSVAEGILETHTGVYLIDTNFTMYLESFENVKIPKKPLKSDSVVVKYDDENGQEQTLDSSKYTVYEQERLARIDFDTPNDAKLQTGNDYPVRLEFTIGYGPTTSDVPKSWQTAIKLIVMFYHTRDLPNENNNLGPHDMKALKALINHSVVGRFH